MQSRNQLRALELTALYVSRYDVHVLVTWRLRPAGPTFLTTVVRLPTQHIFRDGASSKKKKASDEASLKSGCWNNKKDEKRPLQHTCGAAPLSIVLRNCFRDGGRCLDVSALQYARFQNCCSHFRMSLSKTGRRQLALCCNIPLSWIPCDFGSQRFQTFEGLTGNNRRQATKSVDVAK